MATITPGRRASIGTIGAGMAMLAFSALASPAAAADNPTPYDGNPSCGDLGLSGFKIDLQPVDGTYTTSSDGVVTETAPGATFPSSLEIEIDDVTTDTEAKTVTFDWHASTDDGDFPIDVVLVKFADGGLRWSYAQPGESADTAWSTQDSISHVSFCFDAGTGSTDSTDTDSSDTNADSTDADSTDASVSATTGATDDQVLGETIARPSAAAAPDTLPVTGSEDVSLAIAGVALVGLGAAGLVMSSRLRRSEGSHYA